MHPVVRRSLLLLGGVGTAVSLGFVAGSAWLFPLLSAAVPYPFFVRDTRDGRYRAAVLWVLAWAVIQSVAVIAATLAFPERAADTVFRGADYAREMLHWVATGEGAESNPSQFLPLHARHFAAFCVLAMVSAGAGALALGAVLLNYMNVYVAELIRASESAWVPVLFGWPVWAVLRVVGFVTVGAALTGWFWNLTRGNPRGLPRAVLLTGLGLVVADALLKALLAPAWQRLLQSGLEGR